MLWMRTFIARRQINELNKYMMKLFGVTYGLMHWKCNAYAMHTKNEINTKKNMNIFLIVPVTHWSFDLDVTKAENSISSHI